MRWEALKQGGGGRAGGGAGGAGAGTGILDIIFNKHASRNVDILFLSNTRRKRYSGDIMRKPRSEE